MKNLGVLLVGGVLSSCTVQRTVQVKNSSSKAIHLVEVLSRGSAPDGKTIMPGDSKDLIFSTSTNFVDLGILRAKQSTSVGGFGVFPDPISYPEEFEEENERWLNRFWLHQFFTRNAGTLEISDEGASLDFGGRVIALEDGGK